MMFLLLVIITVIKFFIPSYYIVYDDGTLGGGYWVLYDIYRFICITYLYICGDCAATTEEEACVPRLH